jgi:hypothetical protein
MRSLWVAPTMMGLSSANECNTVVVYGRFMDGATALPPPNSTDANDLPEYLRAPSWGIDSSVSPSAPECSAAECGEPAAAVAALAARRILVLVRYNESNRGFGITWTCKHFLSHLLIDIESAGYTWIESGGQTGGTTIFTLMITEP